MTIKLFATVLFCLIALHAQSLRAQIIAGDTAKTGEYSHHAISVEAGSVLVDSYAGLQYDYRFTEYLSLRGGLGMNLGLEGKSSFAGSVLGNGLIALTGAAVPEKFLEIGAGATYAFNIAQTSGQAPDAYKILPAATLNYRYQPSGGGITFRTGVSFVYYSAGIFGSIGYAF